LCDLVGIGRCVCACGRSERGEEGSGGFGGQNIGYFDGVVSGRDA